MPFRNGFDDCLPFGCWHDIDAVSDRNVAFLSASDTMKHFTACARQIMTAMCGNNPGVHHILCHECPSK